MGLPPLTYTVTASPLWAYSFTMLSSSFPGTNSETWSVPRVGKTAATSARSFLLQGAHAPGVKAACIDFNKYWGLRKTYYQVMRTKKSGDDALFSHTLPKHPIIFLIQCLIYFHMFLRHVFPLHKERKEKLRPGEQSKLACHWKLSPAFLTPPIALGSPPFSYMAGKSNKLMIRQIHQGIRNDKWRTLVPKSPRWYLRLQHCLNRYSYHVCLIHFHLTLHVSLPPDMRSD